MSKQPPIQKAAKGRQAPPGPEIQEGTGRSPSRDERVKRMVKRHPQRDEPRTDSVEKDETR